MRFIIVICLLLFGSCPALAQSTENTTEAAAAIDYINDFISEEIEKEWAEYVSKLAVYTKKIKAAKFKLRQLKLETLLLRKGKFVHSEPPYSWPASNCKEAAGLKDAIRCTWHFKNIEATDICEVSWIFEADKWYQDANVKCRKIPKITCVGVGCLASPRRPGYKSL